MLNKKLLHCSIVLLLIVVLSTFLFAFSINTGLAADTVLGGVDKLPSDINCSEIGNYSGEAKEQAKQYCGDYELNDFIGIAVKVSQIILSFTGSLALLFFIYGGIMFLISGGSSERVTKAKNIIVGAVVGVFIVFTSYMIIGFVFQATGVDISGTSWSSTGWFNK